MIAGDHEILAGPLFARTVLGEPIVVNRTSEGAFAALEGRCCHRDVQLSLGRKEGDCLRCGHHGLKFDASGRCVAVPGLETVPEHGRVRSDPRQLKNKWLFVWTGDPERANPALLPGNSSCDSPRPTKTAT